MCLGLVAAHFVARQQVVILMSGLSLCGVRTDARKRPDSRGAERPIIACAAAPPSRSTRRGPGEAAGSERTPTESP
jgi:hypothetical protein